MNERSLEVVVLEPDAMQRDLIRLGLKHAGMEVVICLHPDDLRELLSQYRPDLLLIDLHLPGQNGLDMIHDLRMEGYLAFTRVFVISSMGFPEIVQKAAKMGVSDFLVKPLDGGLLTERIMRAFPQGRMGEENELK